MRTFSLIASLISLVFSWPVAAQTPESPFPKGTVGFFRVNATELAASPLTAQYMAIFKAADRDLVDSFLKKLPIDPANAIALTGIAWQPKPRLEPVAVLIAEFSEPVDLKRVGQALGTQPPMKTAKGQMLMGSGFAILAQTSKSLVLGNPNIVAAYPALPRDGRKVLTEALAMSEKTTFSAWLTTELAVLPLEAEANARRSVWPFLQSLTASELIGISLRMEEKSMVATATTLYKDGAAANNSLEYWKLQTELMRGFTKGGAGIASLAPLAAAAIDTPSVRQLFGVDSPEAMDVFKSPAATLTYAYLAGWLAEQDEFLEKLQFQSKANAVALSAKLSPAHVQSGLAVSAVLGGMMVPAIQKVRDAADRMTSQNNLKQIGLALHNYHSAMGTLPPAVVRDKNGKALYSWRVLILPYLEQDVIYKNWKKDEPWDSPHNKPLSDVVLKVYTLPGNLDGVSNRTPYRVFIGKGAGFEELKGQPSKGIRLADITDGTSNTIAVVEATETVPWAKPEELDFVAGKALPPLGSPWRDGFSATFFDGSVRYILKTIKPQSLQAMITRNGEETIGVD
jgi:hypothetical protein